MKIVFIILAIVAGLLLYFTIKHSPPVFKKFIQSNNYDVYFVNAKWCKFCQKFMTIVDQYNAETTNKIKILDGPTLMKQPKNDLQKNIKNEIRGFPTIIVTNNNSPIVLKKRSGMMTLSQLKSFLGSVNN